MKKQRIVVGLSGGVDSAVCAHLCQQQGHEVIGVFMQNWETDNDDPFCTAEQDLNDAHQVAQHLDIEFHAVNFAKAYWDQVFQFCLDEFSRGRTPNPDIWCNKEIKFNVFLEHAKALGADYLATGHYAKISQNQNQQFELRKAHDLNKDQTYFLHALNQHQLQHALFPLGDMTKPQVRELAESLNLPNAKKKDSTGICFIGERRFKAFLKEFILGKPGAITTIDNQHIGQHDGLMYYTLGQRKGLNIGGVKGMPEAAWYVVDKNLETNQLIVAAGDNHPRLLSTELTASDLHWITEKPVFPLTCTAKSRYRQPDQKCTVTAIDTNTIKVIFKSPQRAITPGQSIVFYHKDQCLGGAIIDSHTTLDKKSNGA
jgi:tRNA-uridine 2-sulfurtransferase